VTWVAGVFGLYETLKFRYALPQFDTNTQSNIDTRNYAGFGSATVHFADRVTGRFGARYTSENKSIEQLGVYYTPSPLDQYNVSCCP
jgi:hypothetical protein